MKPTFLLCHGFGFTHEYWRNLIPLLDGDVVYFDKNFIEDRRYIGIGHSIGFQKLNNSAIKFDYLIGLQGFTNFCGTEEEAKEIREQNIDRMMEMYGTNATKSLQMFHNICGYDGSMPENVIAEELIADLQSMKRKYECRCDCPILIIGSDDDEIVPPSILDDNFKHMQNVSLKKINNVSHLLGFKKAEEVAEKISAAVTEISR
ncbi:MAG: alpha/beta hydrolase [Holosporaceae bacterium]|jgi:pimeloyl-[acyl-carrier protein] methyl ester esterase|nr:alpha/beta hydrolase [Holosporaceae bacterium]